MKQRHRLRRRIPNHDRCLRDRCPDDDCPERISERVTLQGPRYPCACLCGERQSAASGRLARAAEGCFPGRFTALVVWRSAWGVCLLAALGAVSMRAAADTGFAANLLWPVSPACVSSPFGPRNLRASPVAHAFHNGIDLPAPVGRTVRAVAPGTVVRVQRKGPGGLEVLIQHDGFVGVYSHLGLVAPPIAEGHRVVRAGQRIGTIGRSGVTIGPHLFFGMIVDQRFVDPAALLGIPPCTASSREQSSAVSHWDRPTAGARLRQSDLGHLGR